MLVIMIIVLLILAGIILSLTISACSKGGMKSAQIQGDCCLYYKCGLDNVLIEYDLVWGKTEETKEGYNVIF